MSTPAGFPPLLYDYWHATDTEILDAILNGRFEGVSVSSLLKAFLDMQLENIDGQDERESPISLKSVVTSKIIAELKSSDDLPAMTRHIARNLDSVTYRQLLSDARLPYRILRTFLRIPSSDIPGWTLMPGRSIISLEEVVLANDDIVQQSKSSDRDHAYLITLKDLSDIFALPDGNGYASFYRKYPPTGGLELFDIYWMDKVSLLSNDTVFIEVFNARTAHILRGLEWTNVCVTGEIVLDALTGGLSRGATPIRLCLFGLNANEANQKLEEIYNVWHTNLPISNRENRVIKTTKSIRLFADPFQFCVEIELQLFDDITDVLLQWEFDPYALSYNGDHVYMLPRCARAIETGYTTFTTRLCWGENLTHCQTRVPSLINLARRGFGLRILPSYMRCLVEGIPETENNRSTETASTEKTRPTISQPCLKNGSLYKNSELGVNPAMLQRESGSKTLKRYALLGRRRLPTVTRSILGLGTYVNEATCQILALQSFSWLLELDEAWNSCLSTPGLCDLYRHRISKPILSYQYLAFPHDQVWDYEDIVAEVDDLNQSLFGDLQFEICRRLQIPLQRFGWSNYLTRRIRRNHHGPTLKLVQEKQITIPLMMPSDLETHIAGYLDTGGAASSRCLPNNSPVINVHDPAKHDPTSAQLPSLIPTEHERGNLKYWVISNESMWVGRDKKHDAVSEVLWCLVAWYMSNCDYAPKPSSDTNTPMCLLYTIRYLRRKIGTLPGVSSVSDKDRRRQGLPTVKESLLFRTFVAGTLLPNLQLPGKPASDDEWIQGDSGIYEPFSQLSDHDYESALEEGFPDWTVG